MSYFAQGFFATGFWAVGFWAEPSATFSAVAEQGYPESSILLATLIPVTLTVNQDSVRITVVQNAPTIRAGSA